MLAEDSSCHQKHAKVLSDTDVEGSLMLSANRKERCCATPLDQRTILNGQEG